MALNEKRWYDKKGIGKYIRAMKYLSDHERDKIVLELKNIISAENPEIMVDHVMEFSLYRNRWYDHDPYCWLVINSLQYADTRLMEKITEYFQSIESRFTMNIP